MLYILSINVYRYVNLTYSSFTDLSVRFQVYIIWKKREGEGETESGMRRERRRREREREEETCKLGGAESGRVGQRSARRGWNFSTNMQYARDRVLIKFNVKSNSEQNLQVEAYTNKLK